MSALPHVTPGAYSFSRQPGVARCTLDGPQLSTQAAAQGWAYTACGIIEQGQDATLGCGQAGPSLLVLPERILPPLSPAVRPLRDEVVAHGAPGVVQLLVAGRVIGQAVITHSKPVLSRPTSCKCLLATSAPDGSDSVATTAIIHLAHTTH